MARMLYHYTNIETLALILRNRTLRFTRLDLLDDPQESLMADFQNPAKMFFVSSWTDDADESIPMWREYASISSGVRIGLPEDPFIRHENDVEATAKALGIPYSIEPNSVPYKPRIRLAEFIGKPYYCVNSAADSILDKVDYVDDLEKLIPEIATEKNGVLSIDNAKIGKYKSTAWRYQSEWRYVLIFAPANPLVLTGIEEMLEKSKMILTDRTEVELPNHYDLSLSDEAFSQMEIFLSPALSPGNEVIAQDLIEKYNPSASLAHSKLQIR